MENNVMIDNHFGGWEKDGREAKFEEEEEEEEL